jgi:uncharacterized protein (UPF0210 family)
LGDFSGSFFVDKWAKYQENYVKLGILVISYITRSGKMNKDEIKKVMEKQVEKIVEQHSTLIKKMNIPEPKIISIDDINKVDESILKIESTLGEAQKEPIVYLIMLKNKLKNPNLREKIEIVFDEIRAEKGKGEWLVSAINDNNWISDSRCLYVGSSGEIMKRMKQHLGIEKLSRKTYSLWLKDWFGKSELLPGIEIYFYIFKGMTSDEIYMIEDILWRGLSPLFGRSGKSPKS